VHNGAWRGWWEQRSLGRQLMDPLVLEFAAGVLRGSGRDCVGAFTLQGTYESNGSVSFVKQYVGRHAVLYQGQSTGEGAIYGRWLIAGLDSGRFALAPEGNAASLPIRELTAADLAPGPAPAAPAPESAVHH
jgi:hypothetical protein